MIAEFTAMSAMQRYSPRFSSLTLVSHSPKDTTEVASLPGLLERKVDIISIDGG